MDKTRVSSEMMSSNVQQQREMQRLASQSSRSWQTQTTTCVPNEVLCFNDFLDRQEIGKGKDSRIYSCNCAKIAAHSVVVKAYDKSKVTDVKIRSIKREARMMNYLTLQKVPNITAFITAFQDEERMYIVMEHCAGGDLLEQLLKEGRAMRERRVVHEVALPLLHTLRHMHALGIIHRDIKLENIFVDESKLIKLGDFGLAMSMQEERAISPVGTLEYMAPETVRLPPAEMIIKGKIKPEDVDSVNEKVDIWALGVTIFELVTGRSPFDGDDKAKVKKAILEGNIRPMPGFVSAECADFITRMMQYDVQLRPSADELLQHPWLLKNMQTVPVPVPVPGASSSHSCPGSPRTSFQAPTPIPSSIPSAAAHHPDAQSAAVASVYQPQHATPIRLPNPSQQPLPLPQNMPAAMPTAAMVGPVTDPVVRLGLIESHNPNAYSYSIQGQVSARFQQPAVNEYPGGGNNQYLPGGSNQYAGGSNGQCLSGGNSQYVSGTADRQYAGGSGSGHYAAGNSCQNVTWVANDSGRVSSRLSNASAPLNVQAAMGAAAGMLMGDGAGFVCSWDSMRSYSASQAQGVGMEPGSAAGSPHSKRKLRHSNSARMNSPGATSTTTSDSQPSNIFERMSQFFSKRLLRKEPQGSSGVTSPHELDADSPMDHGHMAVKLEHMFLSGMNGNASLTQAGSFVLKVPSMSQGAPQDGQQL